jgi:FkbM family methyltransferase
MNLSVIKRLLRVMLGKDVFVREQIKRSKLHYGRKEYDWTFCPEGVSDESIVYSFGIGHDISFDLELIEKFGLNVFAFDPTPRSIAWLESQTLPSSYRYYPFGLSDYDGTLEFFPAQNEQAVSYTELKLNSGQNLQQPIALRVCRLLTICNMLGHDKIEILKMDIEGSEYRAIPDVLQSGIHISQILIEFHHRFKEVGIAKTLEVIEILNGYGYKIFDVSPDGCEYAFIKE